MLILIIFGSFPMTLQELHLILISHPLCISLHGVIFCSCKDFVTNCLSIQKKKKEKEKKDPFWGRRKSLNEHWTISNFYASQYLGILLCFNMIAHYIIIHNSGACCCCLQPLQKDTSCFLTERVSGDVLLLYQSMMIPVSLLWLMPT